MIELLMAITMLNVGILAIVAAFNSGALALSRASRASTATAIADGQVELFRGIKYTSILQDCTEWNSAIGDATYTADTVYQGNLKPAGASPYWVAPKAPVGTVTNSGCTTSSPWPAVTSSTACAATGSPAAMPQSCDPSFLTSGPDGRSYRVDTYLYYDQPTNGGQIKVLTVVVRAATDLGHSLARATSTFDITTGS